EQMRDVVKEFRIEVTRGDVFRRCLVCNCDGYIIVPSGDMVLLHEMYCKGKAATTSQPTPPTTSGRGRGSTALKSYNRFYDEDSSLGARQQQVAVYNFSDESSEDDEDDFYLAANPLGKETHN